MTDRGPAASPADRTSEPRGPSGPAGSAAIVVGVDGSPSSRLALRWAVDRAGQTGQPVHAVIAWDYPVMAGIPVNYGIGQVDAGDWDGNSREILDETIRETLTADEIARVEQHVVHGHPAKVLQEAAADADLLVVGCRGHGGFAGMLLGSVSQHLIAHAPCPVTVVRETEEPGDAGAESGHGTTEEFAAPRASG
jgi:nucleotide-binding universal stress UspA family protein